MTQRQHVLRRWLMGYVVGLFAALPLALPCWTKFLNAWIGRWVTIQAIHVAQYSGLGALAASYAQADEQPRWMLGLLMLLVGGVGLLDELVQRWLPGRVFDWADVGLNLAGGLLGATLCGAVTWLIHWSGRVKA